jgi:hypothetical protein
MTFDGPKPLKVKKTLDLLGLLKWWLGAESNRRHKDFQSSALPTELPSLPKGPRIKWAFHAVGKRQYSYTRFAFLSRNKPVYCSADGV